MEPKKKVKYKVFFTGCLPMTFEVDKGVNVQIDIFAYLKERNKGVRRSQKIVVEKIVNLSKKSSNGKL